MVETLRICSQHETDLPSGSEGKSSVKGYATLCSHLIFLIDVPLKAAELRLMPLSGAPSILAVNVVLLAVVATAQVVRRISLLLCVRVWDVRDVGVVRALL